MFIITLHLSSMNVPITTLPNMADLPASHIWLPKGIPYIMGTPKSSILPSGKLTELWKITIFYGKIHYKWPFSIAMLNYQRVGFSIFVPPLLGIHLWKPPKKTPKRIAGHAAPIQDLGRPDSFEGAHNLNSWVFPPRSSTTQRHPGTMVTPWRCVWECSWDPDGDMGGQNHRHQTWWNSLHSA